MIDDIKKFFKISFPVTTILFLVFLNLFLSNNFFDFGQLFIFQSIFFWLLFLPQLIPLYLILIIGVFQDIIYLSPLGSTSLILFIIIFLFDKYNKFFLEPSFFELFLSFIILFLVGSVSFWLLNSLINFKFLPLDINHFYEFLLNVFFFPINYLFLHICYRKFNLDKRL